MLKENQNLEKNNLELKNNIQKEPDRKMILKNTILATLCCWLLMTMFYQLFNVGIRGMVLRFIGGEKTRPLFNSWWAGFDYPFYFLGFLPFLAIGFYFALKKERKFFFFYPFFFLIPPFLFYTFIYFLSSFDTGCKGCSPTSRMIYLLLLSILIIKIFYLKKERFLLIVTGILFIIFLISTIALANYSITTDSPKLCEKIIETGTSWYVTDNIKDAGYCFFQLAIRTKNPEFCERIREGFGARKARCYQELFFISGKYKDVLKRCQNLSFEKKNQCIKEIAVEQKDIELCKGVENPYHEECEKEVRLTVAIESEKIFESCKTILDKKSQENCIKETTFKMNDFDLCKKILGDIPCKNYFFAIKTNNPDACVEHWDVLTEYDEYNNCITEIAINTNNPQLCETKTHGGKTIGMGWRDCFKTFAVRTKKPEICLKLIEWHDYYESCIKESAE